MRSETIRINIFKEMLDRQNKVYRVGTQLFIDGVNSKVRLVWKYLQDLKVSVTFMSKRNESIKIKIIFVHLQVRHFLRELAMLSTSPLIASRTRLPMHSFYKPRGDNIKALGVFEDTSLGMLHSKNKIFDQGKP